MPLTKVTGRMINRYAVDAAFFGVLPSNTAAVNTSKIQDFLSSSVDEVVFIGGEEYEFSDTIDWASGKRASASGGAYAILSFPSVHDTENLLVNCDTLSNIAFDNIHIKGDRTAFVNDGQDKYGLYMKGCTSFSVTNCKASAVENGFAFRDGCARCFVDNLVGENCYYHSISFWGRNTAVNQHLRAGSLYAYSTGSTESACAITGVFIEETYDSQFSQILAHDCGIGCRIENSCDNAFGQITTHDNWRVGCNFYNFSQRNVVSSITTFNNNRANADAIDTSTTRGNDNTACYGVGFENTCCNNTIGSVSAFQTPGYIVPFASGSDEPWLGSKLQGTTSGAVGRVRKIALTSGSWGGGDAAGEMELVEVAGTFDSYEVIQNVTTRVPYTSGSNKPAPNDVITGSSSGATGTVLWASQQSAADWIGGSSAGYIYLVGVSGTFGTFENLNNTTSGVLNIATTDGASDAVDTDIATTNGAPTAGVSQGFQKYGIAVNIRNIGGGGNDNYNIIRSGQVFNNDAAPITQRGFGNDFQVNTVFNRSEFMRNA